MTPEKDTPEWYLELAGVRSGPYTIQQLEMLRSEGKIRGTDSVTSQYLGTEVVSLDELLGPQSRPKKPFTPPPRPEIDQPAAIEKGNEQGASFQSAFSLFDTLQAARDRKPKGAEVEPQTPEETFKAVRTTFMHRIIVISVMIVLAGVLWYFVDKKVEGSRSSPDTSIARIVDESSSTQPKGQPPAPNVRAAVKNTFAPLRTQIPTPTTTNASQQRDHDRDSDLDRDRDRERERERERDLDRDRQHEEATSPPPTPNDQHSPLLQPADPNHLQQENDLAPTTNPDPNNPPPAPPTFE